MTKYYINQSYEYIGGFDGVEPSENSIEIPFPPQDARQIWGGDDWGPIPLTVPDRVTANQFGKQLAVMGLLDQVQDWVNQQDASTQWSFNRSATFVRDDPMMEAGFTALGFTKEQIDDFFLLASEL